jgi:flagellum-specific peptidoglycan hydrolase FlgJ
MTKDQCSIYHYSFFIHHLIGHWSLVIGSSFWHGIWLGIGYQIWQILQPAPTMLFTMLTLLLTLLTPVTPKESLKPHVLDYIETYKWAAIDEMVRSGIPASVTMAQAIIESNGGTSTLARESNNHFGIKCKSYWSGSTYYHPDDDRDASGKLIPSCFRQYEDVLASYKDHSDFLMKTQHYQGLFGYQKTAYREWSKGLQLCGYATDVKYADKLIRTIELYGLAELDYYTVQYVPKDELIIRDGDVLMKVRK